MKIATISSVYGSYDIIKDQPDQTLQFDKIIVSDAHTGADTGVFVERRSHCHPRLAAKHAKCLPFEYTDADVVIWIDGSIQITSNHWIEFIINDTVGHPISQYAHPVRDDILDEADVSSTMQKYADQPVHAQAHHYLSLGHPRHWGLWATGVIVYRKDTNLSHLLGDFGRFWLSEQVRWTYQDQISEPYVLRELGLRPNVINDNLYSSPYIQLVGHTRED